MFNLFRKPQPQQQETKERSSFFSTHSELLKKPLFGIRDLIYTLNKAQPAVDAIGAMDDSQGGLSIKLASIGQMGLSDGIVNWYASQGFIGHQFSAIISQHWLVNKACSVPARDAIRKGYAIVSVDGDDLPDDSVRVLKHYDRKFKVNNHLQEFIRKGRIFGIRIALFKVESTDPDYYEKPFNIDGVTPNSYKGIVQVDPYWCAPVLDGNAASQPDTMHFYEPTYWIINGKKHHRSHLVIYRHSSPPDFLKPQYLYGGVPLPQMIFERVYAAERTANEGPQLAQTKRTNVWLTDMEKFSADADASLQKINDWAYYKDNHGIKLGDKEGDEFQQYDTSLADLDNVIMTQYQLVASIANVPATKLLGTSPKGFNATGEYEESNYHEELESIQHNDLTPFLERHHMLVMKAYVEPKTGEMVETSIMWNPLDSPTALELAQTNLVKAQIGAALIQSGAIDGSIETKRIALDKTSGYNELGIDDIQSEDVMDEWKEEDHPRADNGQFGSGGGSQKKEVSISKSGEWVSRKKLAELNEKREKEGLKPLTIEEANKDNFLIENTPNGVSVSYFENGIKKTDYLNSINEAISLTENGVAEYIKQKNNKNEEKKQSEKIEKLKKEKAIAENLEKLESSIKSGNVESSAKEALKYAIYKGYTFDPDQKLSVDDNESPVPYRTGAALAVLHKNGWETDSTAIKNNDESFYITAKKGSNTIKIRVSNHGNTTSLHEKPWVNISPDQDKISDMESLLKDADKKKGLSVEW